MSVNRPQHYTSGSIEVIDFIEDQFHSDDFHLANAIKYISRAGKKDPEKYIEDIQKAVWYLQRVVARHAPKGTTLTKQDVLDREAFLAMWGKARNDP